MRRQVALLGVMERLEDRQLLAIDSGLTAPAVDAATAGELQSQYGQLPLNFEVNQGQTDGQVEFLARGAGYSLFLTDAGAVFNLQQASGPAASSAEGVPVASGASGTVISMQFVGANAHPAVTGLDKRETASNYLLGNAPSQWHSDVANFGRVQYKNLYAGIDAVFYGNQQQLEYDFNVAPGADPGQIEWRIQGAEGLSIDESGNLLIHTAAGDLVQQAPSMYQEIDGAQVPVSGRFVLAGDDRVGFAVGSYDASLPLVIDPVLDYASYLGGSSIDQGFSIAVDGAGNAYVTGQAGSTDFPVTPGAYQIDSSSYGEAFVAKLSADGASLIYCSYLGGNGADDGHGIAVDGAGNAYVSGNTSSTDFPTTPDAYQTSRSGLYDGFVAKLSADGASLIYCSYLGGSNQDFVDGIAIDGAGNAYITGSTESTDFPITPDSCQTSYGGGSNDLFVTKLSADGASLVYSSYLGGSATDDVHGIAVDDAGNAYVTGGTESADFPVTPGAYKVSSGVDDAFVTKLSADGASLVYSTYLGGSIHLAGGRADYGYGIAVDAAGNAYVTGQAGSPDFPTTLGAYQSSSAGGSDAFVAKLSADGASLIYSSYLGGNGADYAKGIAVDLAGNAYVTGIAASTNFPVTPDAYQTTRAGQTDVFVTKLSADGASLVYSSYLGGNDADAAYGIAVDAAGNAYITGATRSADFPTTSGAYQTSYTPAADQTIYSDGYDAFVAKFLLSSIAAPNDSDSAPDSVVEGAARGAAVGISAASTDDDGDVITYSLADNGGRFAIDASSGVVTVADGSLIDYESAPGHSYSITVYASDGTFISSQTFHIAVTNAAPATPSDSDPAPNSAIEGATTGTYVGLTAVATDPGGGSLTFSLTADDSGGGFQVDPATGRVTVADGNKLSHNANPSHAYQITVRATDAGGLTASQTFTIDVAERVITGAGAPVSGSELAPLTKVPVATFSHASTTPPAADFTATIDWGDGETSAGSVTLSGTTYTVFGSHVYLSSGTFSIKTTVIEDDVSTVIEGNAAIAAGSPHERFVKAVYQDVLARVPDPRGLAYWIEQLDDGLPISSVAKAIAHSDEYYANFVIKPAYLDLLGRTADDAGVQHWTQLLHDGLTDQQLEAALVSSNEFYNSAGGTDAAWVDAVYRKLLGRPAEADGAAHWTGQLADGQPRWHVAQRIAGSQENNTQLINEDYFHYLGRAADPDGLAYWLKQFAAGKTNEDLIAGLTGSDEYYKEHTN